MPHAPRQIWIGLFELEILPEMHETFDGATYAAVNVLAMAADESEFVSRVITECVNRGFAYLEHESVEPLSQRLARCTPHQTVLDLVEPARTTDCPVCDFPLL